jgi:hypothetical protein
MVLKQTSDRTQVFSKKALLQFCKFFGIAYRGMENDMEFNFVWLHKEYPNIPIRIEAKKLKNVDIEKLFSALTKSELWSTYFSLMAELDREHIALVTQIVGEGLYVIHNSWSMPATPGFTRLVRIASDSEKGIIVEPYQSFLLSLRKVWTPNG